MVRDTEGTSYVTRFIFLKAMWLQAGGPGGQGVSLSGLQGRRPDLGARAQVSALSLGGSELCSKALWVF